MMRRSVQSVILLFLILLSSCGDRVDYEYSSRRIFFTFHNDTHQDPILASALNSMSPGVYCIIRYSYVSGRHSFSLRIIKDCVRVLLCGLMVSTLDWRVGSMWDRTTDL